MKDYSVSGCIVTYNSKDKISPTIKSVLDLTKGVDFTLYIVDNDSTDGTADFIEEAFPEVVVIRAGSNSGFGAGHNKVIPFLKSKYHVVINPDILLREDSITQLCNYADTDEAIGLLSPQIRFEDGRLQMLGKKNPTVRYLGDHFFHKGDEPSKTMIDYCMLDKEGDEPFDITNATGCFMAVLMNASLCILRTAILQEELQKNIRLCTFPPLRFTTFGKERARETISFL